MTIITAPFACVILIDALTSAGDLLDAQTTLLYSLGRTLLAAMLSGMLSYDSNLRKRSPIDSLLLQGLTFSCVVETYHVMKGLLGSNPASAHLLSQMQRADFLEQFMEAAVQAQLKWECLDQFLWRVYFDKHEVESSTGRRSEVQLDECEQYLNSRNNLLSRGDEAGIAFRNSLSRWREHQQLQ
ncbi:MAG: hypothetical protein HXY34_12325 [Candidatus Thorarchaeota archaeon]|nr:hypothetical protein [Candidatus Thorarchaeota archaeon]